MFDRLSSMNAYWGGIIHILSRLKSSVHYIIFLTAPYSGCHHNAWEPLCDVLYEPGGGMAADQHVHLVCPWQISNIIQLVIY
jgi:hypothetical protein